MHVAVTTRSTPVKETTSSSAGAGNDRMHALARDRMVDTIDCGAGDKDVVWLNSKESDVHVNCEIVKTVTTSHPDDGE